MSATNTSATGGYIVDRPPDPANETVVLTALQKMVVGLTGLPGNLVRPSWQPVPPVQPAVDVTWAAVGINNVEADDYPFIVHDGSVTLVGAPGPGADRMQRHYTYSVLVTLYGPGASDLAGTLSDAMYVSQNYESLRAVGMKLRESRTQARNAEFVNQQWIDRIDVAITLRRQIDRVYPVLNIVGADAVLREDGGTVVEVSV
jgi:hypothetical protein